MLTEEERGDAEQSEDGAADGVEARLQQDDPEGGTQQPHHRQLGSHQPGQEEGEATVVRGVPRWRKNSLGFDQRDPDPFLISVATEFCRVEARFWVVLCQVFLPILVLIFRPYIGPNLRMPKKGILQYRLDQFPVRFWKFTVYWWALQLVGGSTACELLP